MKKIILLAICCSLAPSLPAQNLETLLAEAKEGIKYAKCFSENPDHGSNYGSLVWKVTPPQYSIAMDTFYRDSLKLIDNNLYQVKVNDATFKWELIEEFDRNCISTNPDDCFGFIKRKVPESYQLISFNKEQNFTVRETKQLKTTASIQIVDLPFPDLEEGITRHSYTDNNGVVFVKTRAGTWSLWKQVLCTSCGRGPNVAIIQEVLFSKGYYKGPIDNVMNAQTKAALVIFQKERGLSTGLLDLATLKELGLR